MTSMNDATSSLPADLLMAEAQLQDAVVAALASGSARRWSANLRFENLRILPVALRLARALLAKDCPVCIVWPDAGAAALARRDADDLSAITMDFNQLKRMESSSPDGEFCWRLVLSLRITTNLRRCVRATPARY